MTLSLQFQSTLKNGVHLLKSLVSFTFFAYACDIIPASIL